MKKSKDNNAEPVSTNSPISAETRAYLSKVGKAGMRKRWGAKRPDTATVRVHRDVADRLKDEIPLGTRVQWVSNAIRRALDYYKK